MEMHLNTVVCNNEIGCSRFSFQGQCMDCLKAYLTNHTLKVIMIVLVKDLAELVWEYVRDFKSKNKHI